MFVLCVRRSGGAGARQLQGLILVLSEWDPLRSRWVSLGGGLRCGPRMDLQGGTTDL